jgi:hypothetical protein
MRSRNERGPASGMSQQAQKLRRCGVRKVDQDEAGERTRVIGRPGSQGAREPGSKGAREQGSEGESFERRRHLLPAFKREIGVRSGSFEGGSEKQIH